jgi:hypothetical protein
MVLNAPWNMRFFRRKYPDLFRRPKSISTSSQPNDSDFPLFSKFPPEIRYEILSYAGLMRMEEFFRTKDLHQLARLICSYEHEDAIQHMWLVSLVSAPSS